MRGWIVALTVLAFTAGLAGGVPSSAAAQQTPPPKTAGAAAPPHQEAAADDLFLPPLRGTPGGRISGGTRGLNLTPPSAQPNPTPAKAGNGAGGATVKSTPAQLIPIAE